MKSILSFFLIILTSVCLCCNHSKQPPLLGIWEINDGNTTFYYHFISVNTGLHILNEWRTYNNKKQLMNSGTFYLDKDTIWLKYTIQNNLEDSAKLVIRAMSQNEIIVDEITPVFTLNFSPPKRDYIYQRTFKLSKFIGEFNSMKSSNIEGPATENTKTLQKNLTKITNDLFFKINFSATKKNIFKYLNSQSLLQHLNNAYKSDKEYFNFVRLPALPDLNFSKGRIVIDTVQQAGEDDPPVFSTMELYFPTKDLMDLAFTKIFEYCKAGAGSFHSNKDWEDLTKQNGNMIFESVFLPTEDELVKQLQIFKVIENVNMPNYYIVIQPWKIARDLYRPEIDYRVILNY